MEIDVLIDDGVEGCPEAGWIRGITEQTLIAQDAGTDVELSLVITGQERIKLLNKSYRGKDEPTDVLAFCMTEISNDTEPGTSAFITPPDGISHLGEVIISCPQAIIQAEEHRHSVNKEIAILIIHGVLHLLGYDHEEPEQMRRMQACEKEILGNISSYLE